MYKSKEEVDERVKEVLSSEDIDIIIDLRELNEGAASKYKLFRDKCSEYISKCTAVPERRHGDVCFMATVISVRDLTVQVTKKCLPGTPIQSESWVRLKFSPRNPHTKLAKHYQGRLKVKHVVQKRMFWKAHPDEHYCAALFGTSVNLLSNITSSHHLFASLTNTELKSESQGTQWQRQSVVVK